MGDLSEETVVAVTDEQLSTELDDEEVILQTDSNTYYGLNGVGTRIWELLDEPRTVRTIQETITEEYEVDPVRCRGDVQRFLTELKAADLVEVEDAARS